ncbi:hypothetical protein AVEN_126022-1, partial [Araneus ventricosus]
GFYVTLESSVTPRDFFLPGNFGSGYNTDISKTDLWIILRIFRLLFKAWPTNEVAILDLTAHGDVIQNFIFVYDAFFISNEDVYNDKSTRTDIAFHSPMITCCPGGLFDSIRAAELTVTADGRNRRLPELLFVET